MGVDVQRATSQPPLLPEHKLFFLGNRRQGDGSLWPHQRWDAEVKPLVVRLVCRSFFDIQEWVTRTRQELQKWLPSPVHYLCFGSSRGAGSGFAKRVPSRWNKRGSIPGMYTGVCSSSQWVPGPDWSQRTVGKRTQCPQCTFLGVSLAIWSHCISYLCELGH